MNNLLTILGPTACGKTTFAAQLAYDMDGEIISADSRQVYRGMDIGTGKDLADYHVKDKDIPYHLIDIAEAGTRYNVYEWQKGFLDAYADITERGKRPSSAEERACISRVSSKDMSSTGESSRPSTPSSLDWTSVVISVARRSVGVCVPVWKKA